MLRLLLTNPIPLLAIIFGIVLILDLRGKNREFTILKVILTALLIVVSMMTQQWLLVVVWILNFAFQMKVLLSLFQVMNNSYSGQTSIPDTHRIGYAGNGTLCPQCSRLLPEDAHFCPYCAREVYAPPTINPPYQTQRPRVHCENCKRDVPPDSQFCPQCGNPVVYYGRTRVL